MSIAKIVITGGPCGGKTSAFSKIKEAYTALGYTVLFIHETATELISGGLSPDICSSSLEYQRYVMRLQLYKEKVMSTAAEALDKKVLIVCDRGALDNKAYLSDGEFETLLKELDINETELRDSYDAVFHLVSAACGAEQFYTVANNSARTETAAEARRLDGRVISVWTGHPHFRMIDNSTDFNGKMDRLINEISSFLGEPEPLETERKFLIEYPDIAALTNDPNCKKLEITQTYLPSESEVERRVRSRGYNGSDLYYYTEKSARSAATRYESEKRITKEEYNRFLESAGEDPPQIRKDRYCLSYDFQYFEIDVYPFWDDKAILEIELTDKNADIRFPSFIKILREVTGEKEYSNSSLAKRKKSHD